MSIPPCSDARGGTITPYAMVPPLTSEQGGMLTGAFINAREAYPYPGGNLECMLSTLMLGHHKAFMRHVVLMSCMAIVV